MVEKEINLNQGIKEVHYTTDTSGRVSGWDYVILNDGTQVGKKVTAKHFVNMFKQKLRIIVAGEIITPEEYYRFSTSKATPHSLEQHLKTVEAKARVGAMGMGKLSGRQKVAIGVILILIFGMVIGVIMLKGAGILNF